MGVKCGMICRGHQYWKQLAALLSESRCADARPFCVKHIRRRQEALDVRARTIHRVKPNGTVAAIRREDKTQPVRRPSRMRCMGAIRRQLQVTGAIRVDESNLARA